MNEYYSLEDKIEALKKEFNVDFKDLRSCIFQENSSITAYKNIDTGYIYKYDCFTNYWQEDKEDIFNYTSFGFEDKNYEIK